MDVAFYLKWGFGRQGRGFYSGSWFLGDVALSLQLCLQNIASLSVTVPGLSVSVTGLSVIVYGLSVSVYGLSVTNFPDSRIQSVKVTNWPVNFTGLSGTVTDRPAKVTDCTVTLPARLVSHHIQSGSPYLGQDRYLLQTGLFD